MIENFHERIITSADTRAQAIRAFGFDEAANADKLRRENFDSDEAYFDAVAMMAVRHDNPTYRSAYLETRRKFYAEKEAEAQRAAEQKRAEEIEAAIKSCTLTEAEQLRVDSEARSRAQGDLAVGKISYQQMGQAVEDYAKTLTEAAKVEKVHRADFNAQIRAEMAKIVKGY